MTLKNQLIAVVTFPCLTILLIGSVGYAQEIEFNRDVRPILSNLCFTCHGPDSETRESGLRLDKRSGATQPAESGEIPIVPGDVSASELIRRIITDDSDERMPPIDSGKHLTVGQIETLKSWIMQGSKYESHWAFVPPRSPEVPEYANDHWSRNEIDRFVMQRLVRQQTSPAKRATRETLIRRVAFDLTGLPPTLEEIDAFVSDRSPTAYERIIEQYIESPAYGEHMARHWLDLARYADSNGYQYDTQREQWVWRDWVIDAYNKNIPFDQFTIEQLAGDLLPNATPEQRLATGFNRNHGITIEGGIIDEEYRTEYVMDRLVTTSGVWMGLTVGCARCHDHKFDPISQQEFYQMYAFFNQVPERGMQGFAPKERIPSPLADAQQLRHKSELEKLKTELENPVDIEKELGKWIDQIASSPIRGWQALTPLAMKSSGGSLFTELDDRSLVVGGANPNKDIYEITSQTDMTGLTAVRLEALTHKSLPGGGPGRHSNSNFVLSEFELSAVSIKDPTQKKKVKFVRAVANYSQANYEISKSIDGNVAGNNGWAVDGPTRKKPAAAMFIATAPFGYEGGTELTFRLRHEATFATHGIGRPRLSVTNDAVDTLELDAVPVELKNLAGMQKDTFNAADRSALRDFFLKHHHPKKALQKQIAALERQLANAFPETMIMRELATPRDTFVLNRGQYNEPTTKVKPGVPAVFQPFPKSARDNRLGLARWLVDPAHPLTARVAVNRYWQRMFGTGLVKTSEDFGVQGDLPSHPELLDWLALEFIRSGWDIKHIHRLILNSATYQQTSHVGKSAYTDDPDNRLLARGPRMRLDGEEIRDTVLASSGLLVRRLGGKSVFPYQPAGLWLELNNRPGFSREYKRGSGGELYRRSLYTFWKRTVPSPMLKTFDAPEREFCTIRRSRTNTPLQALLLLNGPQFVEAARHLGNRIIAGGDSIEERIGLGFRLVTGRKPNLIEMKVLKESLEAEIERYRIEPAAALRLLQVGDSELGNQTNLSERAAYAEFARLLLNLNEAITKG